MKLLYIPITVLAGLSLAGWSAKYVLDNNYGANIVQVGPWSALPFVGGKKVDPYTKSVIAVSGKIPLGAAEGLTFTATNDNDGNELRRNCSYTVSGDTPLSRLWTLVAYDLSGQELRHENDKKSGIFSGALLRFPNSSFKITLDNFPQAGNWMPLSGEGPYKLILRLYDTPIISDIGVIEPNMPAIKLGACE